MSTTQRRGSAIGRFPVTASDALCLAWVVQADVPVPKVLGVKLASRAARRRFKLIV